MIRELFNNCSGMTLPIADEIEADMPLEFLETKGYITSNYEWSEES